MGTFTQKICLGWAKLSGWEEPLFGSIKPAIYGWSAKAGSIRPLSTKNTEIDCRMSVCQVEDLNYPAESDVRLRISSMPTGPKFILWPRKRGLALIAPDLTYRCDIRSDGKSYVALGYYEYDWRMRILALTIVNLALLVALLFAGRAVLDLGFGLVSPFPPMEYVMALAIALLNLGMVVLLFAVMDLITIGSQKAVKQFLSKIARQEA